MLSKICTKLGRCNTTLAASASLSLRPYHVSASVQYIKCYDRPPDVIGIDLGTSTSCVAIMEGKSIRVLENAEGARTTPSIVAFTKEGQRLVGSAAKHQAVTNPTHTLTGVKRLIGRYFHHPEVQQVQKIVPYKLVQAGDTSEFYVEAQGKKYTPIEISSMVLGKMKETAESALGRSVGRAVITVPAHFTDMQRDATRAAAKLAGLEVRRIYNEPAAAALAYGLQDTIEAKIIAVFDFGGGTFDISIMEADYGVFEMKATSGDITLGGDDFDQILVKYLLVEFEKETGTDLSSDPRAMQRLREAAESAKKELDGLSATEVSLPVITADAAGPKHLKVNITRAKYESLVEHLVERTLAPCQACLEDSGVKKTEISEVILVGGMSRMPKVQRTVEAFFGRTPASHVDPNEVVATGAAILGNVLRGDVKDVLLFDVAEENKEGQDVR